MCLGKYLANEKSRLEVKLQVVGSRAYLISDVDAPFEEHVVGSQEKLSVEADAAVCIKAFKHEHMVRITHIVIIAVLVACFGKVKRGLVDPFPLSNPLHIASILVSGGIGYQAVVHKVEVGNCRKLGDGAERLLRARFLEDPASLDRTATMYE